jgi:sugar O-acyltransferase (sialic acid O-acetyltransferase NeuD family)
VKLLVIGAGGFGREVLQYVRDAPSGDLEPCGFIDDRPDALSGFALGITILGSIDTYAPAADERAVVAVGDPVVRRWLALRATARGYAFASVIHPRAYVAPSARLDAGVIVAPFAFVAPHSWVGSHVVLNTHASVGHDSAVEPYAVLSPYAVVNGNCKIGEGVFMGTSAAVQPGKVVGRYSKLSAGALVAQHVSPCSLMVGNPATGRVMFKEPA